jgi:hypothetical protein
MLLYAQTNSDQFPKMSHLAGANTAVTGFKGGAPPLATSVTAGSTTTGPITGLLADNATAPLWSLVRDGSANVKNYICPSSGDTKDDLTRGTGTKVPIALSDLWDFDDRSDLSFSMLNMYHTQLSQKWSTSVSADWALLTDNNNADSTTCHTHAKNDTTQASIAQLQTDENSKNHSNGEGQNLGYGDGHVTFASDPFQGPSDDNVFAADSDASVTSESATRPQRSETATTQGPQNGTNVVMMPLSGNVDTNGRLTP